MTREGSAGRLGVFLGFLGASAGFLALLLVGGPSAAPPPEEALRALEAQMRSGARLHPRVALPEPAGTALFCRECHPLPPHPGRAVNAAMMNEHAQRMDCLLCHWSAENGPRPAPVWQVHAGGSARLAVVPAGRASREDLARLRAGATARRRCFERGPGCDGCHRPGGMGGMLPPGASPGRVAAMERLESFFTLAPGQRWYFPEFR